MGCGTESGAGAKVDGGIIVEEAGYVGWVEYGAIEYMSGLLSGCETGGYWAMCGGGCWCVAWPPGGPEFRWWSYDDWGRPMASILDNGGSEWVGGDCCDGAATAASAAAAADGGCC